MFVSFLVKSFATFVHSHCWLEIMPDVSVVVSSQEVNIERIENAT